MRVNDEPMISYMTAVVVVNINIQFAHGGSDGPG